MALVNCHECGREISSLAASCPGCGAPVPRSLPGAAAVPATSGGIRATWWRPTKPLGLILHLVGIAVFGHGAAQSDGGNALSGLPFLLAGAGIVYYGGTAWTRRQWIRGMALFAAFSALTILMVILADHP